MKDPYKLLWYLVPVILVLSIGGMGVTLDIQSHDFYLIISAFHIALFFAVIVALEGGIYYVFWHKHLRLGLTRIHVWTTVLGLILYSAGTTVVKMLEESNSVTMRSLNEFLTGVLLVTIIAQLLFLTNLAMAAAKAVNRKIN